VHSRNAICPLPGWRNISAPHHKQGGAGIDLDRPTLPWSQRSWLWRDYGNRVGGWKLLDLFEDLQLPVGVIVNTANYYHNPELLEAHRQRGDEIIAHGRSNAERQLDMTEADERTMIAEVTQTLVQHTGQRPAGWLSPYLTPSLRYYRTLPPAQQLTGA
jgi:allantoinase